MNWEHQAARLASEITHRESRWGPPVAATPRHLLVPRWWDWPVRLGGARVTSIDVDPCLTRIAAQRLDGLGLHPRPVTGDATGPLPGTYDRIVPRWQSGPFRRAGRAAARRAPGHRHRPNRTDHHRR
jgi:hypothetical protein